MALLFSLPLCGRVAGDPARKWDVYARADKLSGWGRGRTNSENRVIFTTRYPRRGPLKNSADSARKTSQKI